ncbi:lysozyme inhibitor LprI family protein [Erwiniaceae bacterium CAU 1747]
MQKILLTGILLCTLSTPALAEESFGKAADNKLQKCTANAENTLASVECYDVALAAWDAELNNQYRLLLANGSAEFKSAMKVSQVAWIAYRDAYIKAMQSDYRQRQGTIWGIIMSEARLRITRDKAIELYKLRKSTDLGN